VAPWVVQEVVTTNEDQTGTGLMASASELQRFEAKTDFRPDQSCAGTPDFRRDRIGAWMINLGSFAH